MSEPAVKQIVLASRPKGLPTHENFRLQDVPMPELPQGGLLLRVLYLSLDPYMRGRMDDRKSYAKPVGPGEVMTGESVCEVMTSDQADYAVGDIVTAPTGWRTHATFGLGHIFPFSIPTHSCLETIYDGCSFRGPRGQSGRKGRNIAGLHRATKERCGKY